MITSVSSIPDNPLIIDLTNEEWECVDEMLLSLKKEEQRTKKKGLNQFEPDRIEEVRHEVSDRERNMVELKPIEFAIISDAAYDTKSRHPNKNSDEMITAQEKIHTVDEELSFVETQNECQRVIKSLTL